MLAAASAAENLFDDKTNKGTRTKTVADGDSKVRVGVKSGTKFSSAGM